MVTLLFTDIEGSTRLVERLGPDYARALAEHHRLLRDAIGRHDGVEVDTAGDAFFVAFASAPDALAAAEDAQRALEKAGEIRVRMGIHTGAPIRTEEGYVGMDVHRAARLADAGHGGQILVSRSSRELVEAERLVDLGIHRLKDVGELHVYQVGTEEFPPLRSQRGTNLPATVGPLIGRREDASEVLRLVRESHARLVTITGAGGIGKTRLAIDVASSLLEDARDGVWFVDLSSIVDPELLEPAIGAAVGAGAELIGHLRDREVVLVLDNFEQIIDAADRLVLLLDGCPGVTMIVTSREALRLRGEHGYPLRPLEERASIELFRRRATAVDADFDAGDDVLAALSERLDGIPLAIELAAARAKVMNAAQLLDRLDERLPILTGGARDLPERQRTLRAAIEWSFDLLDEPERRLFANLAVFAGGWSLEAAENVCGATLDPLQALVDKSLVRLDGGRFGMLETIREFAAIQLEESPDAEQVRRRHAVSYAALAKVAEPELVGPNQEEWLERLTIEYENLRAALDWSTSPSGDPAVALQLASGLVVFWFVKGLYPDGLRWLERTFALTDGDRSPGRAAVLWGSGLLSAIVGEEARSTERLEQGLQLARELHDDSLIARSLDVLGLLAFFRNDLKGARASFEESIDFARKAEDRWCLADVLGTIASIYPLQGEFERSARAGAESLDIARRNNDRQGMRMALFAIALLCARRGSLEEAKRAAEEGVEICRAIGDLFFLSYFLWILAMVAADRNEPESARAGAVECMQIAEELGAPLLIVCGLEATAAVARLDGDDAGAEAALRRAVDLGRSGMVPLSYVSSVIRALGELVGARGDRAAARELLEEAASIARGVGDSWGVGRSLTALSSYADAERDRLLREAAAVQAQIGDEAGAAASLEALASITDS